MRYIGIFQIMEPMNLLKPYFGISVTFVPFGIFWCGFHGCAQENELYHFIYVFLSTLGSLYQNNLQLTVKTSDKITGPRNIDH